jgi:hypothetical protein
MIICFIAAVVVLIGVYAIHNDRVAIGRETKEIQAQRYESVFRTCKLQNERHHNTIAAYSTLISKLPPGRQQRAKEGERGIRLLIDALVPVANCRKTALLAITKPPIEPDISPTNH